MCFQNKAKNNLSYKHNQKSNQDCNNLLFKPATRSFWKLTYSSRSITTSHFFFPQNSYATFTVCNNSWKAKTQNELSPRGLFIFWRSKKIVLLYYVENVKRYKWYRKLNKNRLTSCMKNILYFQTFLSESSWDDCRLPA